MAASRAPGDVGALPSADATTVGMRVPIQSENVPPAARNANVMVAAVQPRTPPLNLGISKARMHMATHSSSSREDLDKKSESESEGSFDGRRELGAGI